MLRIDQELLWCTLFAFEHEAQGVSTLAQLQHGHTVDADAGVDAVQSAVTAMARITWHGPVARGGAADVVQVHINEGVGVLNLENQVGGRLLLAKRCGNPDGGSMDLEEQQPSEAVIPFPARGASRRQL